MNNYSTYDGNDYRAPWLRLNKEQMSDPFGWLLSQRNIDVRAILLKMGYNDRQIGFLLYPNQIADKKPGFLQMRQRIGQKAVQTYLKWVFDNEVKKNKIKLGESQLRKIVAESVKKVLSEIDWKTYRNAQEKNRERENEYDENYWKLQDAIEAAHKRGDDKEVQKLQRRQDKMVKNSLRTSKFGFASNDAFNDEFFANSHDRFNKLNGKSFAPFKNTDDGSYSTPEPWVDDSGNIHNGSYFDGHGKIGGKYFDDTIEYSKLGRGGYGNVTYDGEMNGDDNTAYSDEELNSLGIPDNEINDIEKARREIRSYRNGDYTYDNEKGWHLKESVEKAVKKPY